ncbi:hypothetical protein FACS1894190_01210 [Spirochaetia bacterium]|nr:hypothetical protein FACS1894190_01210 [Spirochaetia bacterium]
MENNYKILGVSENASFDEIKKAFRKKAKELHPDIAGAGADPHMQKLLDAYQVLSNRNRRAQYDRLFKRTIKTYSFNYRDFLKEQAGSLEYRAKLIIFDLLNFNEDDAIALWHKTGGAEFPLKKYIGREDFMDCAFILADELSKRGFYHDAFLLLTEIIHEEHIKPYFRHFTVDVLNFLKTVLYSKLKPNVDEKTWAGYLQTLNRLNVNF